MRNVQYTGGITPCDTMYGEVSWTLLRSNLRSHTIRASLNRHASDNALTSPNTALIAMRAAASMTRHLKPFEKMHSN